MWKKGAVGFEMLSWSESNIILWRFIGSNISKMRIVSEFILIIITHLINLSAKRWCNNF